MRARWSQKERYLELTAETPMWTSAYRHNLKLFLDSGNWKWKQNLDTANSLALQQENIPYTSLPFYNLRKKDYPWQFAIRDPPCHCSHNKKSRDFEN